MAPIGLRAAPTTPEDRAAAEDAITRAYQKENLAKPEFIWTRSPMEAARKCLELGDTKDGLIYAAGYGNHDANWLAFYDYMRNVLGLVEETEELVPLMDHALVGGWYWPYDTICVMSERPIEIYTNERGDLHNFNGAAILYSDGFGLYSFNGLEVPKELALKPVSEFTKQDFLGQENADIRREISNKIGIHKTMELIGATVIDTYSYETKENSGTDRVVHSYELIHVDYDGRGKRPYLKMVNPSIQEIHIEGVPPNTKTVQEALCYRNGVTKWVPPEHLS